MLERRNIGKWLILILLICFLSSGFANADNSELNHSGYTQTSDSSTKELTNDSLFIAYRGTLPETIDQKWENSIANCWLNLTRMGPSYSEFDRSIKSVASNNKVIIIDLDSAYKEEINDSRIDQIYQKIDDYCEQHEGISKIPVVFVWAQDEESLPLPNYGHESFERAKNETGFITYRGKMPEIYKEEEKREWIDLLAKAEHSLPRSAIEPYFAKFGGPVISFGININGYLIVGFEAFTPEKVNKSVIDEIYKIIDEHFEKENISDVPVVFEFSHITVAEGAPADGSNGSDTNESNDTNLSANKERIADNETINKMPDFTSMMGILGLLSLLIIKRS